MGASILLFRVDPICPGAYPSGDRDGRHMAQLSKRPHRRASTTPRLRSAILAQKPDSGFQVLVEIEAGGPVGSAEARGCGSESVELRVAAETAIEALRKATGGTVNLHFVGIKQVQAFDARAVLVSVSTENNLEDRILGVAPLNGNVAEGAALAILSALENHVLPSRRTLAPRVVVPRSRPTAFRSIHTSPV